MNIEEIRSLSLGDWVSWGNHSMRITELIYGGVKGEFNHQELSNWLTIDDIEPIPLTPKILELNGCINTEYGYALYMDNGIVVFLDEDNSYRVIIVKTTVITVRYVHQLQHALRLFGLNELADNLKLEE